ncbi:MAG: phosphotransferase [Thermoguttaceae bacterium]
MTTSSSSHKRVAPKTIEAVLAEYAEDVVAGGVIPLSHPSGLGGADHWFVETLAGPLCLRRTSLADRTLEQVQYSQAVLWHAVWEGFELVPLPIETRDQHGFLVRGDDVWEVLPWFDGEKEELRHQFVPGYPQLSKNSPPSQQMSPYRAVETARIVSAMLTLAQFHGATAMFPLPHAPQTHSHGLADALNQWREWLDGPLERLRHTVATRRDENKLLHEIGVRADAFLQSLETILPSVELHLTRGARLAVAIQPSLGNAHRRHLLFDENGVCGLLDMKDLCADSVTRDVASLLGSLAGSDTMLWNYGMLAYESIRPLDDDELYMVHAFNIASLVLTGLKLLERVYFRNESLASEQYDAIASELAWQEHRLTMLRYRRTGGAAA